MTDTVARFGRPTLLCLAAAGGICCLFFSFRDLPSTTAAEDAMPNRLFEMRTYIAQEGKLDALHARFRDHTTSLFEKHGMTNIGYWTPAEGPEAANTLVYLLAYPNREAREQSWQAFMNDPEWKKAKEESERNGPLVAKVITQFLSPTDYSAIK